MKKLVHKISTYSADWAGVCSALFELGGMLIIHDASGCNSTYATFDEPRWYKSNSMVYISGLTEIDAILGNDNKLINDVIIAAENMEPKFIAIAGSPIPMMTGTDFEGISKVIEKRTGIPTFGFATNGMNYYSGGASLAFEAIARRYCSIVTGRSCSNPTEQGRVNIIGATPLDFSLNGNIRSLKRIFREHGYQIISTWAMDDPLEAISMSGTADVNVVIADSGIAAARFLNEVHGTPYVVGIPAGRSAEKALFRMIEEAISGGESKILMSHEDVTDNKKDITRVLIIGEQVMANSIRYSLKNDYGFSIINVICPLTPDDSILGRDDLCTDEEHDIKEVMRNYDIIIADPIYARILDKGKNTEFIDLPHEAFSGRLFRNRIPILMGDEADKFFVKIRGRYENE